MKMEESVRTLTRIVNNVLCFMDNDADADSLQCVASGSKSPG